MNTFNGEQFLFPNPGFTVDSVFFDPEIRLCAKLNFLSLGMDEEDFQAPTISIIPNPANEVIRFSIPEIRIEKVEVFDLSGRPELSENVSIMNKIAEIRVSTLKPGTYFVKINTELGVFRGKFVKM